MYQPSMDGGYLVDGMLESHSHTTLLTSADFVLQLQLSPEGVPADKFSRVEVDLGAESDKSVLSEWQTPFSLDAPSPAFKPSPPPSILVSYPPSSSACTNSTVVTSPALLIDLPASKLKRVQQACKKTIRVPAPNRRVKVVPHGDASGDDQSNHPCVDPIDLREEDSYQGPIVYRTPKPRVGGSKRQFNDPSKIFPCRVCGSSFSSRSNLFRHHREFHIDENAFRYKCGLCDQRFCRPDKFQRHLINHDRERARERQRVREAEGRDDNFDVAQIVNDMRPRTGYTERCGSCMGCVRDGPCGACLFCEDRPQFGGLGVIRPVQPCMYLRCLSELEATLRRRALRTKPRYGCGTCDECEKADCGACSCCVDGEFFGGMYLMASLCQAKRCTERTELNAYHIVS